MQRKYSEPNAYIDNLPKGKMQQEELYDDVDLPDLPAVRCPVPQAAALLQRALRRPWANIWPGRVSSSEGGGFSNSGKGDSQPLGKSRLLQQGRSECWRGVAKEWGRGFQQGAVRDPQAAGIKSQSFRQQTAWIIW